MNGISMVFQKELKRVFSDKKLIFSLFILPVVMVVVIYGMMMMLIDMVEQDQSAHVAAVALYNMPDSLREFAGDAFFENYEVKELQNDSELEAAKDDILNESLDLIVVFDAGFDEMISGYQPGDAIPDVHTFYNPSADYSGNAWDEVVGEMLEEYRQSLLEKRFQDLNSMEIFSVDADNEDSVIQDDDRAGGKMLGSIIPYLVTVLLFAGGMGIGIDMIAGEKERGTMASLLITPVKRTSIVLGKLFAMMLLSGLSALVYVISMVVAMPFIMGSEMGDEAMEMSSEAAETAHSFGMSMSFQAWQIWMLIFVIVSMVFVYVSLITLTAVYAKDTKEASTYITPIYMIVMLSGMVTMFTGDNAGTGTYCIPLYGAVVAMKNILGQDITIPNCLLCVLTHLIAGGVVVLIVARAFGSEKVMFDA